MSVRFCVSGSDCGEERNRAPLRFPSEGAFPRRSPTYKIEFVTNSAVTPTLELTPPITKPSQSDDSNCGAFVQMQFDFFFLGGGVGCSVSPKQDQAQRA